MEFEGVMEGFIGLYVGSKEGVVVGRWIGMCVGDEYE